jgi:hypothetical protein
LSIDLNGAEAEVHTNGRDVAFVESVVCEAEEETGLADV